MSGILIIFRDAFSTYYTDDLIIKQKANDGLLVLGFSLLSDSIMNSQLGTCRGLGKQKVAVIVQVSTFLFIAIPLGCIFAF
jgi:Na+-driven multidrug efflux pump